MRLLDYFEGKPRWLVAGLGFAAIGIVGVMDFVTGRELSIAVFYLLPIAFVTWFVRRKAGVVISLIGALVWFIADYLDATDANPIIIYWNGFMMLGFFLVFTDILDKLHDALGREQVLARKDHLTGAENSRSFLEILAEEMERSRRYGHPFTVAYIDLDNFKQVNDRFGHSAGNEVLCRVVGVIRSHLRTTDTVARLGGDEFALLLTETGFAQADAVFRKIHPILLDAMGERGWPVTFSIGVVTYAVPPPTVDEAIRRADDLMYAVKNSGKNRVRHELAGDG